MKDAAPDIAGAARTWLRQAFACAVVAFAWWRFSDNTVDNDLWGHVLYGQRMLARGGLETTESLSWTAAGLPWINHEVLAEVAMGLVHRFAGGAGLWGMMVVLASATVGWAWNTGAGQTNAQRVTALALLALCTNFIALGYAVRPQLFTYLFFVALLVALRRMLDGRTRAAWFIPPLLALWANTHGGFLAGWLTLLAAVTIETATPLLPIVARRFQPPPVTTRQLVLLATLVGGTLALLVNPWGWELVRWTLATLQLPRPAITEWQPMGFNVGTIPFYSTIALGVVAWTASRAPRRAWELAVWLLFAVMAVRHQRHAPLFGLASLVFLPVHFEDLRQRLAGSAHSLRRLFGRPAVAFITAFALLGAAAWSLAASLRPPRQQPFRIEVPRDTFPVAAIEHLRARQLTGRTITFFDWGQQVLWELPQNPVSFDGRLDTVYPTAVMDAHWRLYAGRDPGPALDLAQAEVALLPSASGGVTLLLHRGWHVAYVDPLATVLTRKPLTAARAPESALRGRVPFPDAPPVLAHR